MLLLMPSGYEIVVILLVVVLLFGGKKIPELMRGLGKGMSEFKKATSELDNIKGEIDQTTSEVKKPIDKQADNKDAKSGQKKTGD